MSSLLKEAHVLFQSTYFLALNKAAGEHWDELVTHGDTDWQALHRLDHATSGALLFAQAEHEEHLRRHLFQTPGNIEKIYVAGCSEPLLDQELPKEVDGFVAQRNRRSKKVKFSPQQEELRGFHNLRHVRHIVEKMPELPCSFGPHRYQIRLITGARHQLRAFFAQQGAPLIGDPLYGGKEAPRLQLHAWKLKFRCPFSSEVVRIEAALP